MKSMTFGVLLIIGGILFILGSVLGINIPIIRILLGIVVIYWGIQIITGGGKSSWNWETKKVSSENQAIFAEANFAYPNANSSDEYTTVFGESKLDLTQNSDQLIGKKIKFVTVFGESEIILKKDFPVRIKSETVLGNTNILEQGAATVGKYSYQTPGLQAADIALELEVKTVFGQIKIRSQE